jgi:hypothetical protein
MEVGGLEATGVSSKSVSAMSNSIHSAGFTMLVIIVYNRFRGGRFLFLGRTHLLFFNRFE